MATRAERLLKLQRMLGQIREIEEAKQARLDEAARQIDQRRKNLAATIGNSESYGVGISQSFALQYIRKARDQVSAEHQARQQGKQVLSVARREASAERIATSAIAKERAAQADDELIEILERTAAAVTTARTRLP